MSFRTVNSRKKFAIMNKNLQRLPFFQCFHTVTHKVTEKASDLYRNPVPAIQKSSLFEGPNNPKQRCALCSADTGILENNAASVYIETAVTQVPLIFTL